MTRCLGLDLSLTATGFADHAGTGLIRAPKGETGIERIETIAMAVVERARLNHVVIMESHAFSARQQYAHEIGELFGVVKYLLYIQGIPVVEVPPASLKKYAPARGTRTRTRSSLLRSGASGFPGRTTTRPTRGFCTRWARPGTRVTTGPRTGGLCSWGSTGRASCQVGRR